MYNNLEDDEIIEMYRIICHQNNYTDEYYPMEDFEKVMGGTIEQYKNKLAVHFNKQDDGFYINAHQQIQSTTKQQYIDDIKQFLYLYNINN